MASCSCTPLSVAVPLDGTEHELGVQQLQKYVTNKPSIRSQYRRFKGPFLEYLSMEDVQRKAKNWKAFLQHEEKRVPRRSLEAYTFPGSVVALCERMDENLAEFTVHYFHVLVVVVFMVLGAWRGFLTAALGLSYLWLRDPDRQFTLRWDRVKEITLEYIYPMIAVVLMLLTSIGVRLTSGLLLGLGLNLAHAACHRAPSELRYLKQRSIVRWLRRHRAPLEGAQLLWEDVQLHAGIMAVSMRDLLQWRLLRVQEIARLRMASFGRHFKRDTIFVA